MIRLQDHYAVADNHKSVRMREGVALVALLVGGGLVWRSFFSEGFGAEWTLSVGVACILLFMLYSVERIKFNKGIVGLGERMLAGQLLLLVGVGCAFVSTLDGTAWGRALALEFGVGFGFIGFVDIAIGSLVQRASEAESEQAKFYDDLAEAVAVHLELPFWNYQWMRYGLDEYVKERELKTRVQKVQALLEMARKAKNLPGEFQPCNVLDPSEAARDWRLLWLLTDTAERYGLTDDEYMYVAAAMNVKSDPRSPIFSIKPCRLDEEVDAAAQLVLQSRGVFNELLFWRRNDPLEIIDYIKADGNPAHSEDEAF